MGFWVFMLAMNLIIPLSMIFLGKYFSKRAPGQINMLFGPYGAFDEKSGHMAVCTSLFWKTVV